MLFCLILDKISVYVEKNKIIQGYIAGWQARFLILQSILNDE